MRSSAWACAAGLAGVGGAPRLAVGVCRWTPVARVTKPSPLNVNFWYWTAFQWVLPTCARLVNRAGAHAAPWGPRPFGGSFRAHLQGQRAGVRGPGRAPPAPAPRMAVCKLGHRSSCSSGVSVARVGVSVTRAWGGLCWQLRVLGDRLPPQPERARASCPGGTVQSRLLPRLGWWTGLEGVHRCLLTAVLLEEGWLRLREAARTCSSAQCPLQTRAGPCAEGAFRS